MISSNDILDWYRTGSGSDRIINSTGPRVQDGSRRASRRPERWNVVANCDHLKRLKFSPVREELDLRAGSCPLPTAHCTLHTVRIPRLSRIACNFHYFRV